MNEIDFPPTGHAMDSYRGSGREGEAWKGWSFSLARWPSSWMDQRLLTTLLCIPVWRLQRWWVRLLTKWRNAGYDVMKQQYSDMVFAQGMACSNTHNFKYCHTGIHNVNLSVFLFEGKKKLEVRFSSLNDQSSHASRPAWPDTIQDVTK